MPSASLQRFSLSALTASSGIAGALAPPGAAFGCICACARYRRGGSGGGGRTKTELFKPRNLWFPTVTPKLRSGLADSVGVLAKQSKKTPADKARLRHTFVTSANGAAARPQDQ